MLDFRQTHARRYYVAVVAGFVALMVAATAYNLWRLRNEALDRYLELAATQARSFEDSLSQSMNNVDLMLRGLVDPADIRRGPQRVGDVFALALRSMPHLRSLSLLDHNGRIVASSNPHNIGQQIDGTGFLPPTTARSEILRIGAPWEGRDFDRGRPSTPSQPVAADALSFVPAWRGIVVGERSWSLLAAVNSDYFINQFGQHIPAANGHVDVLRLDGVLLLSTDAAEEPGASRLLPGIDLAQAHVGTLIGQGHHHQLQLTAYRVSRHLPFAVVVDFDHAAALAQWQREAHTIGTAMLLSLLAVIGLASYLYLRMAAAATAQAAADRRLRLAARVFDASTEGIVVTDAQARILSVNRAFTTITGYAPEAVLGKNPHVLSSGQHDREFYAAMWNEIATKGHWQGEIFNRRMNGATYPEWLSISCVKDNQGAITHYVGVFSDITERKASEERIRYLSEHDFLTALPNRFLFQDRVAQAIVHAQRQNQRLAILFIDLDHFKHINDSIGHHVGDQLLKEVATRLTACVRATDTVCRQGGDEFLILAEAIEAPQDAARIAEKLLERVPQPYLIEGHEISITPSVGIALYPDDGRDMSALIRCADVAMYHSKEQGRNAYHYYTPAMNATATERLALEHGLKRSLARGELELHYQPQVAINSGSVIGAEALLRWTHPELGAISPLKFIPIAEESNLIVPLGEWVIRNACSQAAEWRRNGLPELTLAVNVSALQFAQPGFIDSVRNILDETGMPGNYLEFEVTESVLMAQIEHRAADLEQLRNLGIRLAIDDFGTGYSSLSYLHKLPIDKLKIDRSFIRDVTLDPDDATITATIVRMAHAIGLRVVAEGVETNDQLAFLRARGCDEAQGFLTGAPMPPREFSAFLRRGKGRLRRVA